MKRDDDPDVRAILDSTADLIEAGVWPPEQLPFCGCGLAKIIMPASDGETGIVVCPTCDRSS